MLESKHHLRGEITLLRIVDLSIVFGVKMMDF